MEVILAEHAGTCYGVERALSIADSVAQEGVPAQTLGPLIHNPRVVMSLKGKHIEVANSVDDVTCNTVILRSHGVLPEVRDKLEKMGVRVVDATCPYVARAQDAAYQLGCKHKTVLVLGESGHPEVDGLIAYAKLSGCSVIVASGIGELPMHFSGSIGIVVQTTQKKSVLDEVVSYLERLGVNFELVNTICSATTVRQKAALSVARRVDAMVVLGGMNSSNTARLFQICFEVCQRCVHVEAISEIDKSFFDGCKTIGLAAGASTPKNQIEEALEELKEFKLV